MALRQAGAAAVPRYAATESGYIGCGCLAPEAADEVYLLHDLHALIQPRPDPSPGRIPPLTLFISSLRPTAALVLLNVSLGDQAVVTRLAVLDIVPTHAMWTRMNKALATSAYHWLFLIQPDGLPERLIGADPESFLREQLKRWGHRAETLAAREAFL